MPLGAAHQRRAAEGNPLVKRDVVPDFRRFADHDAHRMIDEQAAADAGAGMDLDTGEDTRELRNHPCRQKKPVSPGGLGDPMHEDGVQARIAQQNLQLRSGGRVAGGDAGDVFANTLEHAGTPCAILRARGACWLRNITFPHTDSE
jgi:hypothetical protein